MRTRNVVVAAVAFALLAAVALWAVWPGPSDEEKILEAIHAVADGARAGDVLATMKPVSRDYVDEQGLTYDDVRGFLFREFKRRGGITVMLSDIEVTLHGDTADADFHALLADGIDIASLDLLPGDADSFTFHVQLARDGGDWKITGSSYERGSPDRWPMM
jgi:hypothetical protein